MKGIINPYIRSEHAFDEYTRWLQSRGEVWHIANNVYMVTSYRGVREALSDDELYATNDIEKKIEKIIQQTGDTRLAKSRPYLQQWLIWMRGDGHSHWKKNLLQNFHSLNDLTEIVTHSAQRAIGQFFSKPQQERELVSELLDPFVSRVILKTLNYNETSQIDIRQWSMQIRQILDPVWNDETIHNTSNGLAGLTRLLKDNKIFGPNFLDKTFEEQNLEDLNILYGNLQFFILAGVETSLYFFARAILVLLETGLYKTVEWDNPREVKIVTEELLRFISPVVFLQRETTASVRLGGVDIPQGAVLMLNTNSANRDPAVFKDPFHLDFHRSHYNHISFGHKKHVCFGKALSLLEITTFLPLFFKEIRKHKKIEVIAAEYEKMTLLRGLKALRIVPCP